MLFMFKNFQVFAHFIDILSDSTIKPVQFSYVVYKAFLKYLYTDVIDLPIEKTSGKSTTLCVRSSIYSHD